MEGFKLIWSVGADSLVFRDLDLVPEVLYAGNHPLYSVNGIVCVTATRLGALRDVVGGSQHGTQLLLYVLLRCAEDFAIILKRNLVISSIRT